jgi:hypothetical protein
MCSQAMLRLEGRVVAGGPPAERMLRSSSILGRGDLDLAGVSLSTGRHPETSSARSRGVEIRCHSGFKKCIGREGVRVGRGWMMPRGAHRVAKTTF